MRLANSLIASLFLLTAFACQSESPRVPLAAPAATAPAAPSAAASPNSSSPVDPAALLAAKTAQYVQDMSPVIAARNSPTNPGPSAVQWVAPKPNTDAALAAANIHEDSSVPQMLPESADQAAPAAAPAAFKTSPAKPAVANAPAVAVPTDEYERQLQQQIQGAPRDLGVQLDYQLLRLVRNESAPDLSLMGSMSDEDRETLSALLDGLNNFRSEVHGDDNAMLSKKIQPLVEMADRLRSTADLTIPTITLCSRVDGFGVYTPLPSSTFPAGQDVGVVVYCEVANFTSNPNPQGLWETRLREQIILYTDNGAAVWPTNPAPQSLVDQSRNRRHDFFIAQPIRLPATLAAGHYILKVTLTDEHSNRVAESNTAMDLTAP